MKKNKNILIKQWKFNKKWKKLENIENYKKNFNLIKYYIFEKM